MGERRETEGQIVAPCDTFDNRLREREESRKAA